jgi:haloalkane dehalogenase
MPKVLLTSVCRPLGPAHGDAPSVGYELLHGQVTRAQGRFSPRSLHLHFSLEFIAENLEAPCVVLQYPSRRELVRELRKGYDVVCVSFLLAVYHRMKEVVALVREHAPAAKIVLGGYGTTLPDELLTPYADHVCREEGVGFMRRLLGEPPRTGPFRHPLVVSRLELFGFEVSRTGMIFAGLGCPNGCDFCCTSHFFHRRHVKLLASGAEMYRVVERYLELDPDLSLVVLDEDFLLDRRRAREFRELVLADGRALSMFVFASIRALSRLHVEELVEMGVDGVWIGYEGTRSGYAKQEGRDPQELFAELRAHGITILASMIVGLPYQDEEIVAAELDGLLALEPDLCQFLIYGPTPGTPFWDEVQREGLLRKDLAADPALYARTADGFSAMVEHPRLSGAQIEALQRRCFEEDFQRLGPSIFRTIDTWLRGHRTLSASANPALRRKAARIARDLRAAYPVFLAGRLLGPNRAVRERIRQLERRVHARLGPPSFRERLRSLVAVGAALWTGLTLRLDLFQHPRLVKHAYRMPQESPRPARIWRRLRRLELPVTLELRPERTVWVRLEGLLHAQEARHLAERLREALERTRDHLVLDLERLTDLEGEAARRLVEALSEHRARIRVLAPAICSSTGAVAALAVFGPYAGGGVG